jgi:hypothetical protein
MQATRETFRHLSLTGQFYKAAFDGARRLGPPALREAARAGAVANRRAVDAAEERAATQLREAGLQIEALPDRGAFIAALDAPMQSWRDRLGPERITRIQATPSG